MVCNTIFSTNLTSVMVDFENDVHAVGKEGSQQLCGIQLKHLYHLHHYS